MNLKNSMKKFVEMIAIRFAVKDVNTACPYISYQPKLPEAARKLKKYDDYL